MQISPSAFTSGINTIQSGQRRVEQAAGEIASAPVSNERAQMQGSTAQINQNSDARSDLASNLVDMRVGQYEAQAGARVVQTADRVLGTLIDVTA